MPPLSFEEPKGGPFAKTARIEYQAKHRAKEPDEQVEQSAEDEPAVEPEPAESQAVEHPTEQLSALFVTEDTEETDEADGEEAPRERREPFLLRGLVEAGSGSAAPVRTPRRDTVLVILKAATVALGIALVGFIVLLATSGGDEQDAKSPSVPNIPTSHDPSAGPLTSTTDLGAIVAPPVHSQTAEITPPPQSTQPSVPTGGPSSTDDNQFVQIGDKCDTLGAYAFTRRHEPVVCDQGRGNNRLVWRPLFR